MDETFAAYLTRVQLHRAELGESMAARDAALALPVGQGAVWRRRVRAALTELAHDLRDHVELTEGPGGLYEDLRRSAPRLARRDQQHLADPEVVLAEVERLHGDRDEGLADPESVAAHREAATALVGVLVRHRQRGSDLVWEAYDLDLGGSG